MVYLLYWLITPRKPPRVRVHDGNQETWSRLSHQNHSPSLLPWFVTPAGRAAAVTLSSELRRSDTTNHLRGSRCATLEVVRARVCRTRRAAGFRAVHEAATFRIVASAGAGGHLLAVLLLRFLGVLRARAKSKRSLVSLPLVPARVPAPLAVSRAVHAYDPRARLSRRVARTPSLRALSLASRSPSFPLTRVALPSSSSSRPTVSWYQIKQSFIKS